MCVALMAKLQDSASRCRSVQCNNAISTVLHVALTSSHLERGVKIVRVEDEHRELMLRQPVLGHEFGLHAPCVGLTHHRSTRVAVPRPKEPNCLDGLRQPALHLEHVDDDLVVTGYATVRTHSSLCLIHVYHVVWLVSARLSARVLIAPSWSATLPIKLIASGDAKATDTHRVTSAPGCPSVEGIGAKY